MNFIQSYDILEIQSCLNNLYNPKLFVVLYDEAFFLFTPIHNIVFVL